MPRKFDQFDFLSVFVRVSRQRVSVLTISWFVRRFLQSKKDVDNAHKKLSSLYKLLEGTTLALVDAKMALNQLHIPR